MLITEQKPMEEILQYLDGEKDIFLVGCKGCSEGCETGGEQQVAEMKQRLEQLKEENPKRYHKIMKRRKQSKKKIVEQLKRLKKEDPEQFKEIMQQIK